MSMIKGIENDCQEIDRSKYLINSFRVAPSSSYSNATTLITLQEQLALHLETSPEKAQNPS
ncbi:hypothetical protein [Legionella rowbothamii]|uniref:hypothetical protein n=1 Tax=Legionella rowbothamii TaxID=96229 RepID=UPI00105569D3|nr:hypothetical protein [Legionella rowbothamii]